MPKKFVLTYDEHYDADIASALQGIPTKRRSERLRQLIRLGLAAERQGLSLGPTAQSVNAQPDPPSSDESGASKRKPLRGYTPPSATS